MTGRYKTYPEYKDSGVEWLEDIPVDWDVSRLKFVASIFGRIGFRGYTTADIVDEGEGALVLSPSNVSEGKLDLSSKAFLSWDKYYESPEIIVEPNDILLVKTGSTFGKSAIVDDSSEPMTINPQMALLKRSKIPPKYLAYVMSSKLIKSLIDVSNTGSGMPTMTQENINSFPIPIPLFEDALQIANFLDHETAKIDTLIAKQEKLIELLKEKRQAVISHAVTKGLNSNAPMKDSGVEWLGEVPEHWVVSSLGYYANLNTGATPDRSNTSYWDGDIPWIKTGEVRYDTIYDTEESISSLAVKDTAVKISPSGTLLMAMYGQGVTRGRVAILGVPATYNQACVAIEANNLMWNEYLKVFFIAAYHAIRDGGNETSQMNLNADIVSKFKVTIPPIIEQRDIVKYLESVLPQFDALIEKSEKAIKLIQERKIALISAAVTGKIDVRGWEVE